jgi:exopolysaccharide/PEP-CTERM locus tyrosine autokinase
MTQQNALKAQPSLLERAAEIYDFGSGLKVAPPIELPPAPEPRPESRSESRPQPEPVLECVQQPEVEDDFFAEPVPAPEPVRRPAPKAAPAIMPHRRPARAAVQSVDREALSRGGYILPDAPVTSLAEEFRLIKRQLLRASEATDANRSVLIASAQPGEGKTFCALNLALSLASERDLEVLLVDGDFSKPQVLKILGLEGEAGLVDALEDPALDVEQLLIPTDLAGLCVLPSGRHVNNVPELLASDRTRDVLARLTGAPRRIVIFDSPPVLAASPAAILAAHVGQVLMVVRADRTTEADLREAAGHLSACDELSLLLNGAGFAATGRRYGNYNGYGQ